MPLVEYLCEDCGAQLELLHRSNDPRPRICGYRCVLPADTEQDCRGFGSLTRQISGFATVNRDITRDHPGHEELGRAGFSIYANEGKKGLRHLAGPERIPPETLKKK
jgi:DNA-directed RNA polymerase subunit RPC12/RpoP